MGNVRLTCILNDVDEIESYPVRILFCPGLKKVSQLLYNSLYLLRDDFSVKGCYIPDEGETFLDVAWIADRFLVFCGTTKSHGYLDYDNPLLVVWDTQTNQTYKEYSSIKKTKGFLYTKIVKLPQDCLAVLFNVEASDTYAIKDIIAK